MPESVFSLTSSGLIKSLYPAGTGILFATVSLTSLLAEYI
jgi:hypothetical protein